MVSMNRSIRELYERASELEPSERAELAGLLLENLEEAEASRTEIEEAWAAEVEKRMADYRAGLVKTVSWEDLRAHLHRSDR
jgi:putative addiction module component, TIGR02574 family